MKPPPGFEYSRVVPPSWQNRLAQLTPRTELRSWLQLAWMSGDPWEVSTAVDGTQHAGVQRWVVYEMMPLRVWIGQIQEQRAREGKKPEETMEQFILDALQGPNPRELGHYDTVLKRFITSADCTRQEWELYREYKAIPLLYWIIQGGFGGHKRTYSKVESQHLRLRRLPSVAPLPGSLPYAEFDERVLEMLARRERIQQGRHYLGENEAERDAAHIAFRRELVDWLTDQQRALLESVRINLSNLPTSSDKADDPTAEIEAAAERFIQTGSTKPEGEL